MLGESESVIDEGRFVVRFRLLVVCHELFSFFLLIFNRYPSQIIPNLRKFLLDGLEKIKTRGYDGAGMATMTPQGGGMVSSFEFRAKIFHHLATGICI